MNTTNSRREGPPSLEENYFTKEKDALEKNDQMLALQAKLDQYGQRICELELTALAMADALQEVMRAVSKLVVYVFGDARECAQRDDPKNRTH